VAISDAMVAAMHTYLSGLHSDSDADSDAALNESDRQFLALLKSDQIEGLGELVLAAFTIAARRQFSPTWIPAEIVRFVAGVRSRSSEMATLLQPSAAENQLRIALGNTVTPYPEMEARGRAQMVLLNALTSNYSPQELASLLSDARALAEQAIDASLRE
jgi:hypothetical protein